MMKKTFKRVAPGLYTMGDWTITETEGEQREPGYHWASHHHDKGEHYHSTLAAAKADVIRIETSPAQVRLAGIKKFYADVVETLKYEPDTDPVKLADAMAASLRNAKHLFTSPAFYGFVAVTEEERNG